MGGDIRGTVVSGFGGFYQVLPEGGGPILNCRGRGRIKRSFDRIYTGDQVRVSPQEAGRGMVEEIYPRRNCLQRPHIVNIDQVVIVMSWRLPDLDLLLLDNMLLMCALAQVRPLLALNKIDLLQPGEEAELAAIRQAYAQAGLPLLTLSAAEGRGLAELRLALAGQRSVLAGPSGVGKSSLLNLILPEEHAETGAVSDRLQRGKHTTRYVRLLQLEQGGMLADTPGFFVLDTPPAVDQYNLPALYPEYARICAGEEGCRFESCRHDQEPDCAVKAALEQGRLDPGRYRRYLRILHQIQQREVDHK